MCTRNGLPYLREQVSSILAQSRPPTQFVLSDDASSDETVAVVRELLAPTSIELVVIENTTPLGVTKNFEQAMLACTGDLIALSDQDDVWTEQRLATAVAEFEARPELLLLHSDARLIDGDGTPLRYSLFDGIGLAAHERAEIAGGEELATLLRRNVVTGATTMVRRELLERAAPFPAPWVHDEWLAVIAAVLGETDAVFAPLIDYRQHGSNQIGARKLSAVDKVSELRGSRAERSAYLVARAEVLLTRLKQLGSLVPPQVLVLVERKVAHERRRRDFPAMRIARGGAVIREMRSGEYSAFGRPNSDIVRDLLQPER